MALEHRVPIIVVGATRIDGVYEVTTADIIYPEQFDNTPEAVRAITQRFTADLERLIRRAPDQYFWVHRRWKRAGEVVA